MNSYSGLLAGNLQLSTPWNKFDLFGAYNYVLKSGSNRLRCLQSSDVNFGITGGKTLFNCKNKNTFNLSKFSFYFL